MKKIVSLVLSAFLACSLLVFSGCSTSAATTTLYVYNWGEYMPDGTDGSMDVIAAFEEKYPDIDVVYDTFVSNEALYAKLKSGAANYDVIVPSDYMVARLIEEGMIQKLNFDNIPNFSNIMDDFKDPVYDPGSEYSVPFSWGTVGVIYNTTMVEGTPDSWDILWDEKYSGDILMIGNQRDAIAVALKRLGFSMNTTDETELLGAENELKKQKDLLQAYVMDQSYNKMEGNSAALCLYYSGDALAMMENNPDLSFAVPEEGSNYYMDSMCIPKNAKNMDEAHEYINFMLEAESGLRNSEEVYGSTPNKETFKLLDPDSQASEVMYPSDEVLAKSEMYSALPEDTYKLYDEIWKNLGQ